MFRRATIDDKVASSLDAWGVGGFQREQGLLGCRKIAWYLNFTCTGCLSRLSFKTTKR
jgi:hypothetical protein